MVVLYHTSSRQQLTLQFLNAWTENVHIFMMYLNFNAMKLAERWHLSRKANTAPGDCGVEAQLYEVVKKETNLIKSSKCNVIKCVLFYWTDPKTHKNISIVLFKHKYVFCAVFKICKHACSFVLLTSFRQTNFKYCN